MRGEKDRSFVKSCLNLLKPSGVPPVLTEENSAFCPQNILECVLMVITINSNCFLKRNQSVGLCSGDVVCF
jgi:hypothetical protein